LTDPRGQKKGSMRLRPAEDGAKTELKLYTPSFSEFYSLLVLTILMTLVSFLPFKHYFSYWLDLINSECIASNLGHVETIAALSFLLLLCSGAVLCTLLWVMRPFY
jgi:hypothetical protein